MPNQSKKKQELAVLLLALIHPETPVGSAGAARNDQFQETSSESKTSAFD
jgi:hypothetical protein